MQEIELLESIVIPDTWFISLVQVGVFQDREQMDGDFVELLNYLQVSTNLQADILSCDWTARGPDRLSDLIRHLHEQVASSQEGNERDRHILAREAILQSILQESLSSFYGTAGDDLYDSLASNTERATNEEVLRPRVMASAKQGIILYPQSLVEQAQMGLIDNMQASNAVDIEEGFAQLKGRIQYWKELGINFVHVLALADSDGDGGFQVVVQGYDKPLVINHCGGMTAFKEFSEECKKEGIVIMADIVANHISMKSPILQEVDGKKVIHVLEAGQLQPLEDRYVVNPDANIGGVGVVYLSSSGEEWVRVIFPDQHDAASAHVAEFVANEKLVRAVCSFYPGQVDTNLLNAEAFYMIASMIRQFKEWGVDVTRLDAIPHICKIIEKLILAGNEQALAVVAMLRVYQELVNPGSAMLAEAVVPREELPDYVGRADMGYDFPAQAALMHAIVSGEIGYWADYLNEAMSSGNIAIFQNLVLALTTHDDMFIDSGNPHVAEYRSRLRILASNERCKAFGLAPGHEREEPPSYVTTLYELCNRNEDRMLATIAMAYFAPHKHVLSFNGMELRRELNQEYFDEVEIPAAKLQDRNTDRRALRRAPTSSDEIAEVYDGKKIKDPFVQAVADLGKARAKYYPDELKYYKIDDDAKAENMLDVRLGGVKDGKEVNLRLLVNNSDQGGRQYDESGDGNLIAASSSSDELEGYGYRLWVVSKSK